jgi:hypothetical protein
MAGLEIYFALLITCDKLNAMERGVMRGGLRRDGESNRILVEQFDLSGFLITIYTGASPLLRVCSGMCVCVFGLLTIDCGVQMLLIWVDSGYYLLAIRTEKRLSLLLAVKHVRLLR